MKTNRQFKDLYVGSDYVAPEGFLRKHAAHRLSPNFANWPIEILKVLGEDYGWVTEGVRPATPDIEQLNQETGSGYGGIIVWAQPRQEPAANRPAAQPPEPTGPSIIIPFVVRNFQMSPLDVFIAGQKVLPLTQKRVAEALMATQIFTGVDRSRKMMQDSLGDQLSPPPEAFYGQFGRPYGSGEATVAGGSRYAAAGARTKEAGAISTQDSIILNQLLSTLSDTEMKTFKDTVYGSPATLAQFVRNKNVDILQRLLKARPLTNDDFRNIARWGFKKNVLLFEKESAGRWSVTMYNDLYPEPDLLQGVPERTLLEKFSDVPEVRERLWDSDGFIVTIDHKEVKPVVWEHDAAPETTEIHSPGVWLVVADNKQVEKGFAWDKFCDFDHNPMSYVLWYDGYCFSVQDHVQGERIEDDTWEFTDAALKPGIWGSWLHKHEGDELHPSMPFKVVAVYKSGVHVCVRATDLFGHDVNFILDPGIEKMTNATGILSPDLADALSGRAYLVPASARFVTLGSMRIRLVETAKEMRSAFRDTAIANLNVMRDRTAPATTAVVTCTDAEQGLYRVEGAILQPLIHSNVSDCKKLCAKWMLVMLGCSTEDAETILARAHGLRGGHLYVMALRPMRGEANVRIDKLTDEVIKVSKVLRRDLVKEAAYIKDRNSVDALLSLNFVNPNNLIVFLENLDKFQEVETNLAKLLLMARFGLEAVPENAVANALKNLNVVNESLEMLRGVLGNQMTPEGEMVFDRLPSMTQGSSLE